MIFTATYKDSSGRERVKEINAVDETEARKKLRRMGISAKNATFAVRPTVSRSKQLQDKKDEVEGKWAENQQNINEKFDSLMDAFGVSEKYKTASTGNITPVKVFSGIVAAGLFWFGFDALMHYETVNTLDSIHQQVSNDFERQYRDVEKYGSAMDKCVRAGLVAEGHLQAGNSSSYEHWKWVEKMDCRAAGLDR